MFLNISTLLKKDSAAVVFMRILGNVSEQPFYRTPLEHCLCAFSDFFAMFF